jgi:hypothetical protein
MIEKQDKTGLSKRAAANAVQHATVETGTMQIALIAPVATVQTRRFRWSFLLLPVMAFFVVVAVREVGLSERALASEGSRSARVLVYEIAPHDDVRLPIEPGTDVVRLVFHALKRGTLAPQPHLARFRVTAKGSEGERTDDLLVPLPGTSDRVAPEDKDLVAGDPAAVNIDVHALGTGELRLHFDDVQLADGILLRAYRRDALQGVDLLRRTGKIDDARGEQLARRAGEVDWIDIDPSEQTAILGARWRKITATQANGGDLPVRALALAPAPPAAVNADDERTTSVLELRDGEKSAVIAHGKASVRGKAESEPLAEVHATVRYDDGNVTTVSGRGEVVVNVAEGSTVGIEFSTSVPTTLAVSASDPARLEPAERAIVYRANPKLPAMVHAESAPIVLRVTARRPVSRSSSVNASMSLDARIDAPGYTPQLVRLRADRARSGYDRYDEHRSDEEPTEPAYFYLIVPPNGTATFAPTDGPMDLGFAELDPRASRLYPTHAIGAPGSPITTIGLAPWPGFATRRPTNAGSFNRDLRHGVRIAPRFAPRVSRPNPSEITYHVLRPRNGGPDAERTIGGRIFESASAQFEVDTVPGQTTLLPLRFFADAPTHLAVLVDDGAPQRKFSGLSQAITVTREFDLAKGETELAGAVVLADDLRGGKHTVRFVVPPESTVWVHAPWQKVHTRRPGKVADPHWVSGDLED